MSRYAIPKGMAARTGTIQWIEGLAVQPSQNIETLSSGAPRQASGTRRYSSLLYQAGCGILLRVRSR